MAIADNILHLERSVTATAMTSARTESGPAAAPVANRNFYSNGPVMPKFRRRKVSAVRDFPPGCGRFATKTVESSSDSGIAKESHLEVSRNLESTVAIEQTNGLELQKRKPEAASDGPNFVDEMPETAGTRPVEPEKLENFQSSDILGETPQLSLAYAEKGTVPSDALNVGSGHGSPITFKYPPRRRTSAIRDFPPFCGRNAPILGKEECLNNASSLKNNNLVDDLFEKGKTLKDERDCEAKERGGNCLKQDPEKSEVEGTRLGLNFDEVQVEEGHAMSVDPRHNDIIPPHGINQDQSFPQTEDSIGKSNSGTVVLDLGEGILTLKCEKGNKLKHPKESRHENGVQKEAKRIIVLGLMASPNCPWQTPRQAFKKSTSDDGLPESKLEKHSNLHADKSKSESKENVNEAQASGVKTSKESPSVTGEGTHDGTSELIVSGPQDSFVPDERSKKSDSTVRRMKKEAKVSGCKVSKKSLHIPGDAADDIRRELVVWEAQDPLHLDDHNEKPKSASRKKKNEAKNCGKKTPKKTPAIHEEETDDGALQIVLWEPQDALEEQPEYLQVSKRPRGLSVNPLPFGHISLEKTGLVTRNKVRETLRLFQAICRKLLQEEEAKPNPEARPKRVDLQAEAILKEKGRFLHAEKIVGAVPGVEVGDEFQYRVELRIVGLHSPIMGGIDYMKQGDTSIAISVVSSGAYEDDLENSDYLIYTGQGGHVVDKGKEPEDQRLERGNLALSNSITSKNPVRVIRGYRETRASSSSNSKLRTAVLYTYDGLYLVDQYWQETGQHGKLVFKFLLKRIGGQPELAWKVVNKSKKYEVREGLCADDISQGKEPIPISAVNTIDDEKPPAFEYITRVIYPDWCRRIPPMGCECSNGCSDSVKCACAVKNGGEIPYNYNGAIVEAKPLVYECSPSCKCPPSCHNRVSQRGIKVPLEIFKTESRGWGVRSLTSIPSGSFICEYIGELLEDKEAEERAGNDEYLFDIGSNYNDMNLWEGLSTLIPDIHPNPNDIVDEVGFTIDAAQYGNVGRFINHSCSPNLYAQNVLYDYDDKRIPHIMLFAAENIPPLQELTYHYNYMIDQVHDQDGNIKKKSCFCGSSDCTGRMY